MKTCYCYETNKNYKSVKDFFKEEEINMNKYARTTTILRYNQVAEVCNYHIGYDEETVKKEVDEWRQPSLDFDVEVNRKGEARKKSTKILKTPQYDQFGYQYISIRTSEGKQKYLRLHRLVAQAFLPNYSEGLVVDHINGIRDDNRVENLAIKTQQENLQARDINNQPLYQELRRLVKTYGYEGTLEILQQF